MVEHRILDSEYSGTCAVDNYVSSFSLSFLPTLMITDSMHLPLIMPLDLSSVRHTELVLAVISVIVGFAVWNSLQSRKVNQFSPKTILC
jgi:hypothetical protein